MLVEKFMKSDVSGRAETHFKKVSNDRQPRRTRQFSRVRSAPKQAIGGVSDLAVDLSDTNRCSFLHLGSPSLTCV